MPNESTTSRLAAGSNAAATLAHLALLAPTATLKLEGIGLQLARRGRLASTSENELCLIVAGGSPPAGQTFAAWSADGVSATVCLRADEEDNVFFTRVLHVQPLSAEGGTTAGDVEVTLAMPVQIISTRRRASFRTTVSDSDGIELRLWRIDQYAVLRDQPLPSRMLKATLCDLSAGGMRATVWAGKVQALQLVEDQRVRIELKTGEAELILEGRLRHPRSTKRDDPFAICGFEFVFDDDDIESRRNRQKLDAVLAKLQRSAARREAA